MIEVRPAIEDDVSVVQKLIAPFVEKELLLPRSDKEILALSKTGFSATFEDKVIGFAAVEVYSRKLAEIQCLAVDSTFQGKGVGKMLVERCVEFSKEVGVLELMAISLSGSFLKQCGFDYSLPNQKRALFYRPTEE